jgi:hypothetical protein
MRRGIYMSDRPNRPPNLNGRPGGSTLLVRRRKKKLPMIVRALQQQHRADVTDLLDPLSEREERRRMRVERMNGAVARDDGEVHAFGTGHADRVRNARIDLRQMFLTVVQVGDVSDSHRHSQARSSSVLI